MLRTGTRIKHNGFVTNSVVAFGVRPGNPHDIDSWDDLVTGDVEVITPNPFTSGGAQWNLMAAYGSQIVQGGSEQDGLDFIKQILENTPVQDKSARESLQTFIGGKGDVLITYENEAIAAQQAGEDIEYVIPDETILIENPVAVTTDAGEKAQAFRDFLFTAEAQRIYQSKGYRPILEKLHDEKNFPTPEQLFKIDEFGGWDTVRVRVLRPGERIGRGHRGGPGGLHCRLAQQPRQRRQSDCRPARGVASAAPRWVSASPPRTSASSC